MPRLNILFLVTTFILSVQIIYGQDAACFVEKDFLIIYSAKDYNQALLVAQKATKSLEIKLDLRGLIPNNDTLLGLTLPMDTCLKYSIDISAPDSTCYIARGRWDDGLYISIEYSNAYYSFAKGYYIVMVGSGVKSDKKLYESLAKVKRTHKDAYIKSSKVYMCCMH